MDFLKTQNDEVEGIKVSIWSISSFQHLRVHCNSIPNKKIIIGARRDLRVYFARIYIKVRSDTWKLDQE